MQPEEGFRRRGENIGGSKVEASKSTEVDVELRKVRGLNGRYSSQQLYYLLTILARSFGPLLE